MQPDSKQIISTVILAGNSGKRKEIRFPNVQLTAGKAQDRTVWRNNIKTQRRGKS